MRKFGLPLCLAVLFVACNGGPVFACPRFVEFFPDPVEVSDQEGEFVEVRLEAARTLQDSLVVQFENKTPLRFGLPPGGTVRRLLLVHDSTRCPRGESGVLCGSLGSLSLPNSRESIWKLSAGECVDSVTLPVPKAGKSLQRVKETEEWAFAEPTPGYGNPYYELGIADCGIALSGSGRKILLTGCDSSILSVELTDAYSGSRHWDSLVVRHEYGLDRLLASIPAGSGEAYRLRAWLPRDEAPANDSLDTLLLPSTGQGTLPLLRISEVHHCPAEPEPEWVEIYNGTALSLPLSKFRFCNRGGNWPDDSVAPHETLVFSRDTLMLREFLGFREVRLLQVSLGYLNNTAGNLSLCMGDLLVDSVSWDKSTVACPGGFNPRTGRLENTPGFQGRKQEMEPSSSEEPPFTYKLSSRMLRRRGAPLRVYVESGSPVEVRLLDSAGKEVYRRTVPANSSTWWDLPLGGLPPVGIAYVEMSVGRYEKLVGIVLRP